MTRRIGWYFVFVGMVLLAIALVLAIGEQPSGRMFLSGLGGIVAGTWMILRSVGAASAGPPPPQAAPAPAAQSKQTARAPGPPKAAPAKAPAPAKTGAPAKAGGLARMFQPRSKSRP